MKIKSPEITFNEFDLSPVIKIPTRKKLIIRKESILEYLFFLKDEKIYPDIIKINPEINAPDIASSLKKLITLAPSAWITPFISVFPKPKILLPVNLSM